MPRILKPPVWLTPFVAPIDRERHRLAEEVSQIRGLMVLLMKQRNRQGRWTAEERVYIKSQLHHLAEVFPYLVVLALPGSFLFLPFIAWWLDRRRNGARAAIQHNHPAGGGLSPANGDKKD